MHEKTRRWICRVVYLVCCCIPTVSLLVAISYRNSPLFVQRQVASWERVIQQHSGFLTRIDGVSYPRGDVVLLEGVRLTDPDSQRLAVQLRQVELVRSEGRLLVILSQPEVESGQFSRLCEAFHDRLLRGAASPAMQASASEITLKGAPGTLTFRDVQCGVRLDGRTVHAVLEFRVAGIDMAAPARVEVVRNRAAWPPTTGWEVLTGPTPLPCSLLATYFEPLQRLGPDCRFAGRAWAEHGSGGWSGGLTGRFQAVALEHVMAPFPHKLSGAAEVDFDYLAFRSGRLDEAAGVVDCGGGVVSRLLLSKFADAYGCESSARLDQAAAALIAYDRLAARFELGADGLQLQGLCGSAEQGVLVADRHGPLLTQAESRPQPVLALAQALSPDGALHVPATIESDWLLRTLPLPPPMADIPRTADRSGYMPLRLRER